MVRRREEDGPRRTAAIEGEENHYCQLRQALEGVGEGVYSNVETDQGNEGVGEGGGGGGRVQHMKILSALPPGCVLFVPRDAQMVGTQVLPCTIVPRDQVFKMIRANRNNQRRAQRRPEQAKAEEEEEEVVEVRVEDGSKHQEEGHADHAEEETSSHPEECGSSRIEEKDENVGADKKAEELKQKLGAEGVSNLCGSSPELSLPCETTVGDSSKDAPPKSKSNEAITTEARVEVAGLVFIDYSQFDEDEEAGSSYGLGGSTYSLGGRSEDSYNLSQAGVTVDTGPIGLTDEKYRDALEDFIEKTSLEVTQHPASRRRRHGGSVRRQPSLLASLLPRALRPHQRHPRRRRQRRLEHTYEVIASPATKRTRSLLDQQLNHNIAIRD